jgi:hypothetical protein
MERLDGIETFNNTYIAATLSRAPRFSLALAMDRSTDPAETDDPETFQVTETDAKYWFSFAGSYQINMSNVLSLFYGSRRGGLTCLSGTCYEVLPFEGLEIRWTAHF